MQINTEIRYHLTPVRMATINKSTDNKCWRGRGERGPLVPCWWECRLVWSLRKTGWSYPKTLKMELPFYPVIPLLGIYPKKPKTLIHIHLYVHCSIISNSQDLAAAQGPISRWADKKAVVYLHSGILLSHKKRRKSYLSDTWIDLENIMLSETSQLEKDKYHMISLIRGI